MYGNATKDFFVDLHVLGLGSFVTKISGLYPHEEKLERGDDQLISGPNTTQNSI